MPSCPRDQVVAKGEIGIYHCWNRCVQQAFLCGVDKNTGKDYGYRRGWVEHTEQLLAGVFAVEIAFHAVMDNHVHLVLRARPDVPQNWSDRELARRWLCVTKLKRNGADSMVEPTEAEIDKELKKPERVKQLRKRLSCVSWFMGALCECVSRRCNRDSNKTGTFWEHRFKSESLEDEASLLVCGMYVDLNAIRAQLARTPEESIHTSAHARIQGLKQRQQQEAAGQPAADGPLPDRWLCELTLQATDGPLSDDGKPTPWRASDLGILPMSLEKYLELLDWTGRQLRSDKRGAIPSHLAPILTRLGIRGEHFVDAVAGFDQWFGRVIGSASRVRAAAKRAGLRAIHGVRRCECVFG